MMRESLTQNLQQRQVQKLSPQQVRFVKLLEMTGPEVEEEVRRELDDNPALERVDDSIEGHDDDQFNESSEEMQLADYRDEDDIPSYRLEARNHSVNDSRYEPAVVAGGLTLADYLMEQLSQTDISSADIDIARNIIGNLDDNGYLTRSLQSIGDDVVFTTGLDVSPDDMRRVFHLIRTLDPAGVGAVDLRDCLLLQLRRRRPTPAVETAIEIVADYFDLFSLKHYDRLCSLLDIDERQLREAVNAIRSLNPKPGSAFEEADSESSRTIIPDFNIDVDGERITLTLLNAIPDLQIEQTFASADDDVPPGTPARQRQAIAFLRDRRDDAASFIKVLKMRQETLYRVMSAIVKLQRDFFLTDDESRLRPMILKDVAALTGLDLSVISRATAGKYVATRAGIYPLKFFFNERPTDSDDTSAHEILAALREIIAAEDHRRPLSDQAITDRLAARGYDIARRTVAKYRERLGYPVARLRKQL